MATTIPSKIAGPPAAETTSDGAPVGVAKPETRSSSAAPMGGTDAGRVAAAKLAPGRSAPLDGAFAQSKAASAIEDIVVVGKPDNRWYSGWDKNLDQGWIKTAVTPAELKRISDYGMTRTQYNALLTSLYHPQSEQNLALRFNKYDEPRWPKIQAAMTPSERQQAASGQMSPADATRILMRAESGYAWMGTPAKTFTPVDWFPARASGE